MPENAYPWLKSYPANIKWDAVIPERPLYELLDNAEKNYGDKTAIDFLGSRITYRKLAEKVRTLAAALQELGVKSGIRVGIFMPNCPQFIISYYAILKAGGTVVNYNPLYSVPEISYQINDSSTEIMITLSLQLLYSKVAACLGATKLRKIIVSDFQEALPLLKRLAFPIVRQKDIAHVPQDENHLRFAQLLQTNAALKNITTQTSDVAILQYTGGTTGVPKGVILTHGNLYANTIQCGMWFTGLEYGNQMIVGALPLFHVFAMTIVMNLGILTGSAMLLHPKFDIRNILRDIDRKRPTLMPGVPTMFAAFNNYKDTRKYDLTSLKMCISGGGPLPQEVKEQFEKCSGCKLIEGYGLSESSPVAAANPLFGVNKTGSIGIPFPATVIKITDMNDPDKALQTGEIGEICISGPQVMQGYLDKPEESAKVLRNGFLHTGDLGYMDADGYTFIVDRIKEMIISGGYKIYPRNLEEILYKHPDILEAAVIAIPHPERVHVGKVFVVLKEGKMLSEADIKAHLKDKIAAYAMPHLVEFRTTLPKSAIGKILKKVLLEEEGKK